MAKFSKGNVVQLKSGGPHMTVELVDPIVGTAQTYECRWFDAKQVLQKSRFDEEVLVLFTPRPPRNLAAGPSWRR